MLPFISMFTLFLFFQQITAVESDTQSIEGVEDPSQIEAAVAYLIASPKSNNCSTSPLTNSIETQDCKTKTDYSNSYSHKTGFPLRVKTLKRPSTTDLPTIIQKRRRSSPDKSPSPASPPYHRPKITEISVSTEDR